VTAALPRTETSPTKRRWPKVVRELAIVTVVVLAVRAYQQRDAAAGTAPAFVQRSLQGLDVRVPDGHREPTVVYFWATWCGTCEAMRGHVTGLAQEHRVVSVASRSGPAEAVAAYAREKEIRFPVVVDEDDSLRQAYGVRAFPTAFVIDGDGEIAHVEVGYTTELGLRARLWLARWL
jgi:thiol-disulfide isomerase/thioredoxin